MKSWTIRKLLTAGFAAPLFVIAVLAASFFWSLESIRRNVGGILSDNLPGLTLSSKAMEQTLGYRVLTMQHIISQDPEEMQAIDKKCDDLGRAIVDTLKAYEGTIAMQEDRDIFVRVAPALENYRVAARQIRELSAAGREAEAIPLMKTQGTAAFKAYEKAVSDLVSYNAQAAAASGERITTTMKSSSVLVISLSICAGVIALGAGFFITRQVNAVVRRVSKALDDTSSQVTAASSQVSGASQSLAQGASEQAASLEETSASIEELASMTRRNADSAQQTKDLSSQTRIAADTCAADMQAMSTAMDEIKSSSSDISKIIKTIDEIAFQTNILALNAAVEAARAGEAGMGFAVVAEEVRSLAQRSAQSAKETAAKIEVAIAKSEHGVRISGKVGDSLAQILEKARKVDALVAEIATASSEQSQGISQVNTTVTQMDKVTQSNASNAEETAAAAEELSAQAVAMQDVVADLRRLVEGNTSKSAAAASKRVETEAMLASSTAVSRAPSKLRRPQLNGHDRGPAARMEEDLHFADVGPGANGSSFPRS